MSAAKGHKSHVAPHQYLEYCGPNNTALFVKRRPQIFDMTLEHEVGQDRMEC